MQQAFTAHHVESPEFMGIHYMDATTVEECWRLLRQTGKSNSYESLANLPRYTEWLKGQDWTDAYARHKQNLQLVGLNDPEKRWVLKNPSHMTALDALMAVYPDALIVYTHREPVTCIASSCSLSAETTVGHSDTYVGGVIGHTQLDLWSRSFHAFHDARPAYDQAQFVDVAFGDLLADPIGTARGIYDQFGLDWTPETEAAIDGDRPRVQAGLGQAVPPLRPQGLRPHRGPGAGRVREISARRAPIFQQKRVLHVRDYPAGAARSTATRSVVCAQARAEHAARMTPEHIGICLPASWRRRSATAHGVVVSARSALLAPSGVPPEATVRCAAVDTDLSSWRAEAIAELSGRLVDFELEDDDEFELLGTHRRLPPVRPPARRRRRAQRPVVVAGRRPRRDPHLLGRARGLPRLLRRLRGRSPRP